MRRLKLRGQNKELHPGQKTRSPEDSPRLLLGPPILAVVPQQLPWGMGCLAGPPPWQRGVAPGWHLLVHVAFGAGCEVRLHHRLELCLVAAVFENRVVMVTAEDEGFVVREPGTVEAKVVAAFVVRVWLTDPEMCGQD